MSQIREMQVGRMLSQALLYNLVMCLRRKLILAASPAEGIAREAGGASNRESNSGLETFVPTSPACLSTTKELVEKGRDGGEELKKRPHLLFSHDQAGLEDES